MARGEMSLYSDKFAFLIAVKSTATLKYFRSLSQLIALMVINLGETRFPVFSEVDKKHDSATPSGFSLDTGGNTPLVVTGVYELIGTPADLAKLLDREWIESNVILPNALSTICYLRGDQNLVEVFEQEKAKMLDQKREGVTNRDKLAFKLLAGHLEEFKPELTKYKETVGAFGVKKELYRPFQEVLGCLSLLLCLQEKSSFSRVKELGRREIFSEEGVITLCDRVIDAIFLRVKAQLFYQDERDYYLRGGLEKQEEEDMLYLDHDDEVRVEFLYATLLEFYRCALDFSQTKRLEAFRQSNFLGNSSFVVASDMQKLPRNQATVPGLAIYFETSFLLSSDQIAGKNVDEIDKIGRDMQKKHEGEMEAYQRSVVLNPGDWVSALRLAENEMRQGKTEDAFNHYLAASRMIIGEVSVVHAALILSSLGNPLWCERRVTKSAGVL